MADLEGGGLVTGVTPPPFQMSKIKEINKIKQKIGDNPLKKERREKRTRTRRLIESTSQGTEHVSAPGADDNVACAHRIWTVMAYSTNSGTCNGRSAC